MLAEAILVHGVIGYKFCWLLPPEDQNQGTPTGHESNIYAAEAKGNYFRLVTLKIVHPNNTEFYSYDIARTLDKQYVLAGYHSIIKFGQHIMVF